MSPQTPSDQLKTDKTILKRLFRKAKKYQGKTAPNPMVAAAVVKNGIILSEGAHKGCGQPHAEVEAIRKSGKKAKNATLYVTLEPCTHWGKTPPCTDLIIRSGIKKVVWAVDDPNPQVKKNPAEKILKKAGIQIQKNVLPDLAIKINEIFFKNQTQNKPFVILKAGISLDGKIADKEGNPQYLTSEASLKKVHKLRRTVSAILVGINTVLKDNPHLNIRYNLKTKGYQDPIKVILDSKLNLPLDCNILKNKSAQTIIFTEKSMAKTPKFKALQKKGAILFTIEKDKKGYLDWETILKTLYQEGVTSLLIEGGQKVFTSAIQKGIVDKVILFIAPKVLGEKELSLFTKKIQFQKTKLKNITTKRVGEDRMIEGYLHNPI